MKPRFPKTRLMDLECIERNEYKAVMAHATRPFPKLNGNPRREDGWNSIGFKNPAWTTGKASFRYFIADIGKLKRIHTGFHKWERLNSNIPYSAENLCVRLKPEWRKEVCEAIKEEMSKTKDLTAILSALNEMNCPSENGKGFTELTLRQFIKDNRISAKRVEEIS